MPHAPDWQAAVALAGRGHALQLAWAHPVCGSSSRTQSGPQSFCPAPHGEPPVLVPPLLVPPLLAPPSLAPPLGPAPPPAASAPPLSSPPPPLSAPVPPAPPTVPS